MLLQLDAAAIRSKSESELFTGDPSKDNHSPGPVTREINLVTESSAHSEAGIKESVRELQSFTVWGKKLDL